MSHTRNNSASYVPYEDQGIYKFFSSILLNNRKRRQSIEHIMAARVQRRIISHALVLEMRARVDWQ